jgi:hypothetical protein
MSSGTAQQQRFLLLPVCWPGCRTIAGVCCAAVEDILCLTFSASPQLLLQEVVSAPSDGRNGHSLAVEGLLLGCAAFQHAVWSILSSCYAISLQLQYARMMLPVALNAADWFRAC